MTNSITILKAYKTKLRPTAEQNRYFGACCGAARYVFNWALADRIATYEAGGKPNKFEQKRRFNAIKDDVCPWIRDYPYVLTESEFSHVDVAYQNFFRRVKQGAEKAGFPKFKKRGNGSFTLRGSIRIENGLIKLPRIGWVNLAEKSYIPENVKINFVTISESGGDWFVSVQVEEEIELNEVGNDIIGVDVGIKSLAVLSTGESFDNPKTLRQYEKKLATLQRELSRRKKFGANWKKTKKKISKLHRKIANIRKHMQHNISRAVIDHNPAVVVLEDLNVKGMMAKAKPKQNEDGHFEKNGRAAKRGLSKSLTDSGLGELHRQIEYKAEWNGTEIIRVDRFMPSSKTCSNCGCIKSDLTLADRLFRCDDCGFEIDRDLNAALNLAAYGEGVKRPGLPLELEGLPSTVN